MFAPAPLLFRLRCHVVLLALSIILCGTSPAVAQDRRAPDTTGASSPRGALTGQVVDQTTGQPLPGASIQIKRLGRGTASSRDGRFNTYQSPIQLRLEAQLRQTQRYGGGLS